MLNEILLHLIIPTSIISTETSCIYIQITNTFKPSMRGARWSDLTWAIMDLVKFEFDFYL